MRKLVLTLTAVVALAAATLGSTAAPAPAQTSGSVSSGGINHLFGDGSVRFVHERLVRMSSIETSRAVGSRAGGQWPVNILPSIEQDALYRGMAAALGGAMLDGRAALGIGSRLDGWANRDLDIGAFGN